MKTTYLLLMVLFAVNVASAQIITARAEGVVDFVSFSGKFGSDGSVGIATPMTATFVYDTDAAPIESETWSSTYALLSASMSIGNYTFTPFPAGEPATFRIGTMDPAYFFESDRAYYDGTIYYDGVAKARDELPKVYDHIQFCDVLYATVTDPTFTDELPTTSFRDISLAIRRDFRVLIENYDGVYPNWLASRIDIRGELTSLEVIPEPATLLLLGIGGLMLRKKKRQ